MHDSGVALNGKGPIGGNATYDTDGGLHAAAPDAEVTRGELRELVARKRTANTDRAADCRNDGGDQVATVRGWAEAAGMRHTLGCTNVDADANGDPLDAFVAPACLNENPAEFAGPAEINIVRPLHLDG